MDILQSILISGLFIMVTGSCRLQPKNNVVEVAEVNSPEVIETVPEQCHGNFTVETFHPILEQLNLTCSDIYLRFVTDHIVPGNEDLTIWVIPVIDFWDDEYAYPSFCLNSYILLADTGTGKIVSRYSKPNAWSSDMYALTNISIEALDYQLNDDRIVFGICSEYESLLSIFPGNDIFVELFVQEQDSLLSVFQYNPYSYHGENDGGINMNTRIEEYETELIASDHKVNEFRDFALLTKYKLNVTENYEVVQDSVSCDSICFYRFSPHGYTKVDRIEGIACLIDRRETWQESEYLYFGKTLAETYQLVYNENIEGLQPYMRPELPPVTEVLTYHHIDNDSIYIIYEHVFADVLSVTFKRETSKENLTFLEKEGYTHFSYSCYHD